MAFPLLSSEHPTHSTTLQCEAASDEPITSAICKRILSANREPQKTRLELQLTFKNPYSRTQTITNINATSCILDRQNNKIECLFEASREQAAFFAYNEKAVEMNVSVYVSDDLDEACAIIRFESFILATSHPDYTVESINHAFLAKLEPLSDEQKRSITMVNRRSNASDSGDSSAQSSPDMNDRLKNIFILTRAKLILSE